MLPFIVLSIGILFSILMNAADIGSDTAPNRFDTQQTLQNGDRVAGFASLAAGFAMANSGVSGTFDCFFAVEGNVALNYATLILSQDLVFNNVASLNTLGNITGNNHVIDIAATMNPIPNEGLADCSISFLTNATSLNQINSVDWNITGTSIAIAMNNAAGGTNSVQIYSWNGTTVSSLVGTNPPGPGVAGNMNSVSWHPTKNWLAMARTTGTANTKIYNFLVNGTTLTNLTVTDPVLAAGVAVNEIEWRPDGLFFAVGTNTANHLRVYPVTAATGAVGAVTSSITTGQTANTVSWNSDGTFIAVGTVSGTNELQVFSFNGAVLAANATFDVGALAVNSVSWNKYGSNTDIIAVGTAATVAPAKSLRLFRHSSGSLTEISTTIGITTAINSVDWRNDGSCLAVGLSAGTPGGEVRTYKFINNDLTLNSDLEEGINVFAVKWSRDGRYLASGTVASGINDLNIYRLNGSFIDLSNVTFNSVNIFLNGNITLRDVAITFSGDCSINGMGNTLTLAPTFSLIVKEGSSLLLQDVKIEGVNDAKIRGLSNTSTFSLQDVQFVLDGNMTFTQGRLDVLQNFTISGKDRSFIYTSNQEITIRGGRFGSGTKAPFYKGTLMIDEGVTFSYVPANGSSQLLNLESVFSTLALNSGTLIASSLQLTKGRLHIDGLSIIQGSTSVTFGNGIASNNLAIEVWPAANLNLLGNIFYNNV